MTQKNNNTAVSQLFPKSPTGSRFVKKFGHPFKFIEADNPYVSQETKKLKKGFGKVKEKPNWTTEKKYPIRPRTLWRRFEDPTDLIGVSFGKYTHYIVLDLDSGQNPYHPSINERAFRNLLGVLEDIGLVRPIIVRSSWSEGLHVYYFFKEAVNTFNIACAMERVLQEAGIKTRSGQIELFPNTKSFGSFYKAHRLPLQPCTGSVILDDNYQPLTDNLDAFLNMAERTAEYQDMELIKEACDRYGKLVRLERCSRGKGSLKKFENDLLDEFSEGFTAAGQTNHLLLTIACYGVVFMGLDEDGGIEPLVDYIVDTITSLEGYEKYCHHQYEIERRAREVAKSSQRYYWAVGKARKRERKTFRDNFGKIIEDVINGNQAKAARTLQRLQIILDTLKDSGEAIPQTAKAFKIFLTEKSKAAFGEGFSPSTLGKPAYKGLWNPVFKALLVAQVATAIPADAVNVPKAIASVESEAVTEVAEIKNTTPEAEQHEQLQEYTLPPEKTPPEIAETRINKEGYTPCKKESKSESLKPAQNKKGTHLELYGGFGKGEASNSKNQKNSSSLSATSSPDISRELDSEFQHERSQKSKPLLKSQKPASTISPANRSTREKSRPRPRLKSEHKQALSIERQQREQQYLRQMEQQYLRQMEQLHAAQNVLEAQRKTSEYQNIAKQSFDAIKRILGINGANSKGGTPSPPT